MLEINLIRTVPEKVKQALTHRNGTVDIDQIVQMDTEWRKILGELEELNQTKNNANQEVVKLRKAGGDVEAKIAEMKQVSQKIGELKAASDGLHQKLQALLIVIPNIPSEDTPQGMDPEANQVLKQADLPAPKDYKL